MAKTLKELLTDRTKLDADIDIARKNEIPAAIAQVKAIIKDYGLTAKECGFSVSAAITDSSESKPSNPVKPKYITPDGKKTWTGRGKTPLAFKALIAAGQKIEEFLIK